MSSEHYESPMANNITHGLATVVFVGVIKEEWMMHNIKLLIIQNPQWNAKQIAYITGAHIGIVRSAYNELNIPRGKKPAHYVG